MNGPICLFPKFVPPKKPRAMKGPLSQAWDYIVSNKGVCDAAQFDDDHSPIGPSLRDQLSRHGVRSSTSRGTTIIFFANETP